MQFPAITKIKNKGVLSNEHKHDIITNRNPKIPIVFVRKYVGKHSTEESPRKTGLILRKLCGICI